MWIFEEAGSRNETSGVGSRQWGVGVEAGIEKQEFGRELQLPELGDSKVGRCGVLLGVG
jgi:hypothetical protein